MLRTDGTTTARWVVMTDRNGWEKVGQSNVDRVWSINCSPFTGHAARRD